MTFTRDVILKPNGKLFCRYNSNQEMYFRDKEQAEKVAVAWGKVKEVKIVLPVDED